MEAGARQNRGVTDRRSLSVPEGLDGLRLDAALSRLFGLSRTAAVTVIEAGGVSVDGRIRGKSDRVLAGSTLEIDLPSAERAPARPPEVVEGLGSESNIIFPVEAPRVDSDLRVDAAVVTSLPDRLRAVQTGFEATGDVASARSRTT